MIQTAYTYLTNLIAPPICAYCKIFLQTDTLLCLPCTQKIKPLVSHSIAITATKEVKVLCVGAYAQPLRSMILAKSRGYKPMSVLLGNLVWQMSLVRNMPCDIITSIPLHWTRQSWRGYNQAHEIARVIAQHKQAPLVNLLKRVKRTPFLSQVSAAERHSHIEGAFEVIYTDIKDKHILLVDDLMTTGVTLRQAAKALYVYKPASITAVVVARVG